MKSPCGILWKGVLEPLTHVCTDLKTVVLVCKKKIETILLYFKFSRDLVFTNCPTVMPNTGDSSITKRCCEEEYQCTPTNPTRATNPNVYSENRSSSLETGQEK